MTKCKTVRVKKINLELYNLLIDNGYIVIFV